MNLWLYIFIVSILLILLGTFIFPKLSSNTIDYEFPTKPYSTNTHLHSINGIGTMLINGVRQCQISNKNHYANLLITSISLHIGYEFITFLHLPIIPLGCYVFAIGGISGTRKYKQQNYKIYGPVKWSFPELLSIYCNRWGSVAGVISLLSVILG